MVLFYLATITLLSLRAFSALAQDVTSLPTDRSAPNSDLLTILS